MKSLFHVLLAAAALLQAPSPQTFKGTITDSECAKADHRSMHMGDTDAECVKACMDYHDATLVFFDGTSSFGIENQQIAVKYAGRKVKVSGSLDTAGHRIHIQTIEFD